MLNNARSGPRWRELSACFVVIKKYRTVCCSVKTNKGWQACLLEQQPLVAVEVPPIPPCTPTHVLACICTYTVCIGIYMYVYIRKLGGEFLLKQTPGRERVVGAWGGGLQRSGKERICKGKPWDPVSVSEGRAGPSAFHQPRNGPDHGSTSLTF